MADVKMRAILAGDVTDVKCLLTHPMDTGLAKDAKTGGLIPAHYITNVTATLNGKVVVDAEWGGGVSKNPYMWFKVKGAKAGDKVMVKAVDNKGESLSGEAVVVMA